MENPEIKKENFEIPEEPDWEELRRQKDLYATGGDIHELENRIALLRDIYGKSTKDGWKKPNVVFFNKILTGFNVVINRNKTEKAKGLLS